METTYCITLLRPTRLALDDQPAPELKVALPSLVLTPEVGGGGFRQVELVKLAEPQPSRAFSPSSGQKVVLPWQEAEPKCLLSFLGS